MVYEKETIVFVLQYMTEYFVSLGTKNQAFLKTYDRCITQLAKMSIHPELPKSQLTLIYQFYEIALCTDQYIDIVYSRVSYI